MKRYKIIFYAVIITILNSCKSDFDVTAPYKETTVVYGLLNAADTIQWVRINKAFLGEGNAYDMAQQPDSINYPDILDVSLEEYNEGGSHLKTFKLSRDISIPKEGGVFATTPNVLYKLNSNERIRQHNDYKLVVYNRETGKTISANTNVVDSIFLIYPYYAPSFQIDWYKQKTFIVRWNSTPEGVDYQLTIRFHYDEISLSNASDITSKYFDWVFPEIASEANELSQQMDQADFYRYVKLMIPENNSVKRKIGPLDFSFAVAANEFYTYIQVNKPPTGINQNIPQYSNVEGGIGIFSSRLNQAFPGFIMSPVSKDSLIHGSYTNNLNFVLN